MEGGGWKPVGCALLTAEGAVVKATRGSGAKGVSWRLWEGGGEGGADTERWVDGSGGGRRGAGGGGDG